MEKNNKKTLSLVVKVVITIIVFIVFMMLIKTAVNYFLPNDGFDVNPVIEITKNIASIIGAIPFAYLTFLMVTKIQSKKSRKKVEEEIFGDQGGNMIQLDTGQWVTEEEYQEMLLDYDRRYGQEYEEEYEAQGGSYPEEVHIEDYDNPDTEYYSEETQQASDKTYTNNSYDSYSEGYDINADVVDESYKQDNYPPRGTQRQTHTITNEMEEINSQNMPQDFMGGQEEESNYIEEGFNNQEKYGEYYINEEKETIIDEMGERVTKLEEQLIKLIELTQTQEEQIIRLKEEKSDIKTILDKKLKEEQEVDKFSINEQSLDFLEKVVNSEDEILKQQEKLIKNKPLKRNTRDGVLKDEEVDIQPIANKRVTMDKDFPETETEVMVNLPEDVITSEEGVNDNLSEINELLKNLKS